MKRHHRSPAVTPRRSSSVLERINPNAAGIDCGSAAHVVACRPIATRRPCAPLPPSRAICIAWPSGSARVASRTSPWRPPACTGFPCLKFSKRADSASSSSMRATSSMCPAASVMCQIANGGGICIYRRHITRQLPADRGDRHAADLSAPSGRAGRACEHVRAASAESLVHMNVQLPLVVTDMTGVTGLRIVREIVAGQCDPHHVRAGFPGRALAPKRSDP
jgi:transposase